MEQLRRPTSPGEIIKAHYLEPLHLSVTSLAESLGIETVYLTEIIDERQAVDVDMAMRLSLALSTSPELWLNLQSKLDLWKARQEMEKWEAIKPLPNLQEILVS